MGRLSRLLRSRLLPAILTATGVSLIAGGLLTYTGAAELSSPPPSPTTIAVAPTPTIPLPTFPPASGPPRPSASPTPVVDRFATRVVIPALDIDLPVIKPTGGPTAYPQCNVAMYLEDSRLYQPGQGGATYLYAHARDGMFGPIYERAILKRNGGPNSMKGMMVEVYTSDDLLFAYEIDRRPAPSDQAGRPSQRHIGGALAADLRGSQGNARQDPAAGHPDRAAAPGRPRRRQPRREARQLRLGPARLSGRRSRTRARC